MCNGKGRRKEDATLTYKENIIPFTCHKYIFLTPVPANILQLFVVTTTLFAQIMFSEDRPVHICYVASYTKIGLVDLVQLTGIFSFTHNEVAGKQAKVQEVIASFCGLGS